MEKWIDNNNIFKCVDLQNTQYDKLPKGVYNIGLSKTGWFLEKLYDSFEFNFKIYNFHQNYLDYIINYYNNSNGNLGVLFNGLKGSGKTVLAKLLCNQLNLPVIVMKSFNDLNDTLVDFISSINTDVILFYDEFEKTFSDNDNTILTLMDGIYNPTSRKVHILTTNNLHINENLLNRPSRLRYVIDFDSLENKIIEAYIKDNLKDLQYYDKVLELVNSLSDVSIDILKQIISEINLFGFENFELFKNIFNIEFNNFHYNIITSEFFDSSNIKEDFNKVYDELLEYMKNNKIVSQISFGNIIDEQKDANSSSNYYFYKDIISLSKSFYSYKHNELLTGGQIIYINYEKCLILIKSKRDRYKMIAFLNPYNSNVRNYELLM